MTQQDKQWAASRTERQNRWQGACHAFWHSSLRQQKQSQTEHCWFSTTYADLPPPRVIFLSWQTVPKTPRDTETQQMDLNDPPLRFFCIDRSGQQKADYKWVNIKTETKRRRRTKQANTAFPGTVQNPAERCKNEYINHNTNWKEKCYGRPD